MSPLGLFAVATPGLEAPLLAEARARGFDARGVPGGVEIAGGWPDLWRANLELRGAVRVLVRIAEFRALHLAQLDKRCRKIDWAALLPAGAQVKVEAVCRKSRIYHDRAAAQRLRKAVTEAVGAGDGPAVALRLRIEDDLAVISLDSSGEPLHRRGHKEWVGKAPMRESMAAMFLAQCGFTGAEPVVDPMCGSGTFVLEAAEIASDLQPGRGRGFAFETLPSFDPDAIAGLRRAGGATDFTFHGFDRDQGAVQGAAGNAERAGVADCTRFGRQAVSDLTPPEGPPGLVITNPPYGARIGNRKLLFGLYAALGKVMAERFSGWRLGMVTSDGGLAKATGLDLMAGAPVDHSGTKVRLWQSGTL